MANNLRDQERAERQQKSAYLSALASTASDVAGRMAAGESVDTNALLIGMNYLLSSLAELAAQSLDEESR